MRLCDQDGGLSCDKPQFISHYRYQLNASHLWQQQRQLTKCVQMLQK